jgi:hypothetical protein
VKIRTNFTFRIDTWTADGESVVEGTTPLWGFGLLPLGGMCTHPPLSIRSLYLAPSPRRGFSSARGPGSRFGDRRDSALNQV